MSLTIESISCWLVDIPTIRPHKLSMATIESYLAPLLLRDDIVVRLLEFSHGQVTLPQGPVLGIEIDEDKLQFYT